MIDNTSQEYVDKTLESFFKAPRRSGIQRFSGYWIRYTLTSLQDTKTDQQQSLIP